MSQIRLYKTVCQYNKQPLSAEDMQKLQDIAEDCRRVKNYVYARYGGIGGLSKIYPGYTVQNEMTESGLRTELEMPSVYFYLAVFDALGDIKSQWTNTKSKIIKLAGQNENMTEEEKHYLRFIVKADHAFRAVLNQKSVQLPSEMQEKYNRLAANLDVERLNRYLCRQVRKYHVKQHTDIVTGFSAAERAYRYANHGIYISTKQNRKRIFVPLTDNNRYKNQIYIRLKPEDNNIEIRAAVGVSVHSHADYTNQVGIAFGMHTMLTTHEGHSYGEDFGIYQIEYADWMREQNSIYSRNRANNPGRKKYHAKKRRLEERLHSYINHELNRFFQTEKPGWIYIVKLPRAQAAGVSKKINNSVTMWQRGYIKSRLEQKCREQSAEIVEVLGKDISNECSRCGAIGSKKDGIFTCKACGYSVEEKTNTARNVYKRGQEGKALY